MFRFTAYTKRDYDPNWHHKVLCAYLDAFADGKIKRLMVFLPPRHGKALESQTKIMTSNRGWVTHGELAPGDFVFHPSGKPVKVLAVSEKGKANIEVTFSNGAQIRCHENHEWTVYDRGVKKWRTCETNYFYSHTNRWTVRPLITSGKKPRCMYQIPLRTGPLHLASRELILHPYYFGMWLGDGYKESNRITPDPVHAQTIIDKIKNVCGYAVTSENLHPSTGVITFHFSRQDITKRLRQIGVFGNKHIPKEYLLSSVEQRLELLAGLIDSDGHVEKATGRVRIATIRPELRDNIIELARSLGFNPYVYTQTENNSTTLPIKGNHDCYYVGFQPTMDIPTVVKKIERLDFVQRRIGITSVRKLPESEWTECECIQVDSPDGLYLAGTELVPTHNSELVSRRLPAYLLGRNPNEQIVLASYASSLASSMNMDVQSVMDSDEYKSVFPNARLLQKGMTFEGRTPKRTSDYFELSDPAQMGYLKTIGVGGGLTGFGFTKGIIDDPTKNREEADSETYRENVWKWYTSTFATRQNASNAGICLTLTRWHEDDLAGRLLDLAAKDPLADQWTVVTMPAVAEDKPANRNDKRQPGEALWPSKYDLGFLEKQKKNDIRDWNALYQQSPYTEGGSILKKHWWKYYTPLTLPKYLDEIILSVDATFKDLQTSDFVVIQVWARKGPDKYLLDQTKEKMGFNATCAAIKAMVLKYPNARAKLIEDKANGTAIIETLKTKISGIIPIEPQGSKIARAQAVAPQVESGNVYLPVPGGAYDWILDFIDECAKFPNGKHDDQVDACSQALFRLEQAEGHNIRALAKWD